MYLSILKKKKKVTPLLFHALCISFPPVPQPSLFELIEYINCDCPEETLWTSSLGLLSRVMSYSSRFLITTPQLAKPLVLAEARLKSSAPSESSKGSMDCSRREKEKEPLKGEMCLPFYTLWTPAGCPLPATDTHSLWLM